MSCKLGSLLYWWYILNEYEIYVAKISFGKNVSHNQGLHMTLHIFLFYVQYIGSQIEMN